MDEQKYDAMTAKEHERFEGGYAAALLNTPADPRSMYIAGYAAGQQQWVAIESVDDLPEELSSWLISVVGFNGEKWVEEAAWNSGHWWPVRTDGYGQPIKSCEDGRVVAYRPIPEPYQEAK